MTAKGEVNNYSYCFNKNEIIITASIFSDKEKKRVDIYESKFLLNKIESANDIHFSKVRQGTAQYQSSIAITNNITSSNKKNLYTKNDVAGYFEISPKWPLTIKYIDQSITSKDDPSNKEMEFGKDYYAEYTDKVKKNKIVDFEISNIINTNEGSIFVFANLKIINTNTYTSSSQYYSYTGSVDVEKFENIWVFKFDKEKGFLWSIRIPMRQIVEQPNSHAYVKYAAAEGKDYIYLIYNDSKSTFKELAEIGNQDYLKATRTNDGHVVVASISKRDGKYSRDIITGGKKRKSYYNCHLGFPYSNSEFYMVMDLPKKNISKVVKLTF